MEEKVQRLSEGYDFIEESTAFSIEPLEYQPVNEVSIVESNKEESKYKILGKACGVFAPIGEFSRNKRLYDKSLWPTILKEGGELSERVKNRAVYGCIGHEDKRVDDRDLRDGKVSHLISKLEIREDASGKPYLYGELDILNTRAGRDLLGIYEGGGNLYVSSRGAGKLHPVPGQNYSVVLPESYYVNTFDIVLNPGFLQAKPVFEQVDTSSSSETKSSNIQEAVSEEDLHIEVEHDKKETSNKANEELETLKGQVEKLASILEKVVDSIYETEENKTVSEEKKAAILGVMGILSESNIKEETLSEIVDIIKNNLK